MEETLSKSSSQKSGGSSTLDKVLSTPTSKKMKKQQSVVLNGSNADSSAVTAKELKKEKLLRKVLKEELKKKTDRVQELEALLDKQNNRVAELEKEVKDKETRFQDLYYENNMQHDEILELRNKLQAELENTAQMVREMSTGGSNLSQNGSSSKKNKQSTKQIGFNPVSGKPIDDSEMIMNYEKRISEMMMTIQKQERDLLYNQEEYKSIKNIARDLAEQLEPVKKREEEFKVIILQREEELQKAYQHLEEKTILINELKRQLNDESRETNKLVDMRLEFEAKLDKKDIEIHSLKEEVVKQRDEIKGKDEAIKALTMTLLEKGKENQKLSEMVLEIKNHQLETQILGQNFYVQRLGTLKKEDYIFRFIIDKAKDQEYYLELCAPNGKSLRQIPVSDILEIEPLQGTRFVLSYYAPPLGSHLPILGKLAMKQGKIQKDEEFSSRHIPQLKDAFEQILGLMDKDRKELEEMIQQQNGSQGNSSQDEDQDSQDEIVNSKMIGEQFDHERALRQAHAVSSEDESESYPQK